MADPRKTLVEPRKQEIALKPFYSDANQKRYWNLVITTKDACGHSICVSVLDEATLPVLQDVLNVLVPKLGTTKSGGSDVKN